MLLQLALCSSDQICQVLFMQNVVSVDRNMSVATTLLSIYLKVVTHHCTNSIIDFPNRLGYDVKKR